MDHILYWNEVALEANRRDFSNVPGTSAPNPEQGGPTLSSRALAIVHLAIYDAHAAIANSVGLPRYLPTVPPPPPGLEQSTSVAAAAYRCLSELYPRQVAHFDAAFSAAVGFPPGSASPSETFGREIAAAMLADRAADPGAGDDDYDSPPNPCGHRPDPVNPSQGFHAPFYGCRAKLFAVQTARFELDPPPPHGSPAYLRALQQVRGKGVAPELMGALPDTVQARSANESLIGIYWAYDGVRELGTPPRLYNLVAREIAIARGNSVDRNARLFAFLNAAMADAGILAWDQKYIHNFWRPVLGIREHDASMGPASTLPVEELSPDCDPGWLPLGAPASNSSERNFTPPFPAYPSGHATFGAAAFHIIRLFYGIAPGYYGPDVIFNGPFVSEECNGKTTDSNGVIRPRHARRFPHGLWQMIEENGFSRIFLGVHWSFDAFALDDDGKPDLTRNIGGVPLGLKIAEDIFAGGNRLAPAKSSIGPR
jgi:hypothetical protein